MLKIVLGLLTILCLGCGATGQIKNSSGVWYTSHDGYFKNKRVAKVKFNKGAGKQETKIVISEAIKYQTVDGFGAALTDASAWLLAKQMPASLRAEVLNKLFSRRLGIGLNMIRLPIGASDYSKKEHTYNDLPKGKIDVNQENFSIRYDLDYIIPVIKEIKSINPELRIVASPWSPPAWMKTSLSVNGGQLKEEYYYSYALYLTKFILAYRKLGINIDVITVQNEPNYHTRDYPSMLMSPKVQAIIVSHLAELFNQKGIPTKIFVWDHNWNNLKKVLTLLGDPKAGPHISGTAWHAYQGEAAIQSDIRNHYPAKKIYFTEVTGMEAYTNFDHNLYWATKNILIDGFRNWAQAVLYWNIVLDDSHGPHISPMTLDDTNILRGLIQYNKKSKELDYQVEFYALSHLSRFLQPGAVRIYSDTFIKGKKQTIKGSQKEKGLPYSVAFVNPGGGKVVVILNTGYKKQQTFDLQWAGHYSTIMLDKESVKTIVW